MKVIFSRKGFDSSYGGYPSIILPKEMGSKMISFPIPEKGEKSDNNYYDKKIKKYYKQTEAGIKGMGAEDIKFMLGNGPMLSLQDILKDILIKKPVKKPEETKKIKNPANDDIHKKVEIEKTIFHYDPQIQEIDGGNNYASFGQSGAAASHLINEGITKDDIFLFFGIFKETELKEGKIKYKKQKEFHAIWGYMIVDDIFYMVKNAGEYNICKENNPSTKISDSDLREKYKYEKLKEHPHYQNPDKYIEKGNNNIIICSHEGRFGTFKYDENKHKLSTTEKGFTKKYWKLPTCFDDADITYCGKVENKNLNHFESASIGQEFVVTNFDHYIPKGEKTMIEWLKELGVNWSKEKRS